MAMHAIGGLQHAHRFACVILMILARALLHFYLQEYLYLFVASCTEPEPVVAHDTMTCCMFALASHAAYT